MNTKTTVTVETWYSLAINRNVTIGYGYRMVKVKWCPTGFSVGTTALPNLRQ